MVELGRWTKLESPTGCLHLQDPSSKVTQELSHNDLTIVITNVTIRVMEEPRVPHSIKIKLTILRKGRVAAVTSDKTLGQWLEEAIMEKIERERNLIKEV